MVQRPIVTSSLAREKALEGEIASLKQQLQAQEEKHNRSEADLHAELDDAIASIAELQRQQTRMEDQIRAQTKSLLELTQQLQKNNNANNAKNSDTPKAPRVVDDSLNQLDRKGEFPLYRAAAGGHYDEVKSLLDRGANPSMRTRFGWTALHWAAGNKFPDVVRLLLEHGADVNARADVGKLPYHMTTDEGICNMLMVKMMEQPDPSAEHARRLKAFGYEVVANGN
ncbi:ankyrin repeat-containing domain protein [Podospora australis]|uniref:Ankyrin repeat-containing domain protein n=1 Tax=Podospora australis TaxID=1536484 RepID=A0AAN6WKL8_9PEZI|nr:ankyrin repeat-containing domain protein [Podospora australis]